jgi:hypothetical protein
MNSSADGCVFVFFYRIHMNVAMTDVFCVHECCCVPVLTQARQPAKCTEYGAI